MLLRWAPFLWGGGGTCAWGVAKCCWWQVLARGGPPSTLLKFSAQWDGAPNLLGDPASPGSTSRGCDAHCSRSW